MSDSIGTAATYGPSPVTAHSPQQSPKQQQPLSSLHVHPLQPAHHIQPLSPPHSDAGLSKPFTRDSQEIQHVAADVSRPERVSASPSSSQSPMPPPANLALTPHEVSPDLPGNLPSTRISLGPMTPQLNGATRELSEDRVSRVSGSPMAVDTPGLTSSVKRTASGVIKTSRSTYTSPSTVGSKRNSALSELSSDLKTRLSYAMMKVQNGWERQSLSELEQMSPVISAATSPASQPSRRPHSSHFGNAFNIYSDSPTRSLGRALRFSPSDDRVAPSSTAPAAYHYGPSEGRGLAPAAHIESSSSRTAKRRSLNTRVAPSLSSAFQPDGASSQQRPAYHDTPQRQAMLRMPSQQAEKDVVDALIFMRSPNNSGNMKREPAEWTSAPRTDSRMEQAMR